MRWGKGPIGSIGDPGPLARGCFFLGTRQLSKNRPFFYFTSDSTSFSLELVDHVDARLPIYVIDHQCLLRQHISDSTSAG